MTRRKMPDQDDRATMDQEHIDSAREEGEPIWDCDRSSPEWTDGDDARVEREGY